MIKLYKNPPDNNDELHFIIHSTVIKSCIVILNVKPPEFKIKTSGKSVMTDLRDNFSLQK